ncbi:uncharacterized protein LOC108669266 [Hyalella azteca]|uniref:Uncharacterized protein LOC108669266 n=1 Tax=Hyalella azteca TaxID=294128 RepID=A0A8B7NEM3_HYAAZ|nr:uncharacterized protein LOC108669266 [Hyalella azteca]
MRVGTALTIYMLGLVRVGLGRYKYWKPASADLAQLFTFSGQNSSGVLTSEMRCWNWATAKDWTFLACYIPLTDGSGNCSLWDDKPIKNGLVNLTVTPGSNNCMAVFKTDVCVLPGNSLMKVGEMKNNSFCPNLKDVCLPSGMMDVKRAAAPQSCTAPFNVSGDLCLMTTPVVPIVARVRWCDARGFCLRSGADLATVRTDQEFQQFQAFFVAFGRTSSPIWLGSYKTADGQWVWLNSYRNPYTLPDWYPGRPGAGQCGHFNTSTALLADSPCTTFNSVLCRAMVAP